MNGMPMLCIVKTDELITLHAELAQLRGMAGDLLLAAGFDGAESLGLDQEELLALLERHGAMRRLSPQVCRFPIASEYWIREARERAAHPRC